MQSVKNMITYKACKVAQLITDTEPTTTQMKDELHFRMQI